MQNGRTMKQNMTIMTILIMAVVGSPAAAIRSPASLAARLKVGEEGLNCWESLMELQACTGEVIMFFMNGETYLGPTCCQAIRTIGHHCWPAIFGSIGFTADEADVLQGFCDAVAASAVPPPQPTQPPVVSP